MKKLLLLLALTITLLSSAQMKHLEGTWKCADRKGYLMYASIATVNNQTVINSYSYGAFSSSSEKIESKKNGYIISSYKYPEINITLKIKTFTINGLLNRVILKSNDTLIYNRIPIKEINKQLNN
tara:strand:+ start:612 stop:986 length:375 start_codon:yes stop_codon:yes gene_type:complete